MSKKTGGALWLSGSLAFDDLWLPQNGHILLVPLGLLVLLARLTSWNISPQLAVNLLVAVGGFAVMVSMLPPEWRRSARVGHVWLVPGMAVLAFSARQWENWVWLAAPDIHLQHNSDHCLGTFGSCGRLVVVCRRRAVLYYCNVLVRGRQRWYGR